MQSLQGQCPQLRAPGGCQPALGAQRHPARQMPPAQVAFETEGEIAQHSMWGHGGLRAAESDHANKPGS